MKPDTSNATGRSLALLAATALGVTSLSTFAAPAWAADPPRLTVADPGPLTEGDTGWHTVVIPMNLDAPATEMVSGEVSAVPGTADASDFRLLSPFIRIGPGLSQGSIELEVFGDRDVEGDEFANLRLSNVVGATVVTADFQIVIDDDDVAPPVALPVISVADPEPIVEGGPGAVTTLHFPVTLSAPSTEVVSARYLPGALDNIDPFKGDFDVRDGVVTFPPGATTATIDIDVFGDDVWEQDYGVIRVDLISPVNGTIGRSRGIARVDDDDPQPMATIQASSTSVGEGDVDVQLTITMSNPTNRNQEFRLLRSGSADGSDATLASSTATVLDRQLTRVVDLAIHGDGVVEPGETVEVTLESVFVAYMDGRNIWSIVGSPSSATVTIVDDDRLPPDTSIVDGPAPLAASRSASISFASDDPGAAFDCDVDGSGFAPCSSPVSLFNLADGAHHFAVRAASAGLLDATPATVSWTVDASPPQVTVDVPANGAVFTVGDVVVPVVTCVDAGDPAPALSLGVIDTTTASAAPRTFSVDCRDAAGNVATAHRSYPVVAAPQAAHSLRWSTSATRSASRPLDGATVSGDVAIVLASSSGSVVTTSAGIRSVVFRLADGTGGRLVCTVDRAAPYDFVGSAGNLAIRLPTTLLPNGSYRMDAEVSQVSGPSTFVSSSFVIDNGRRSPLAQLLGAWLQRLLVGRC